MEKVSAVNHNLKGIDLAALRETIDDMGGEEGLEMLEQLIDIYLSETPKRLKRMEQAVSSNDASELRQVAHSLKSSSAMLGAMEASAICYQLENLGRSGSVENAKQMVDALAKLCDLVNDSLEYLRKNGKEILL